MRYEYKLVRIELKRGFWVSKPKQDYDAGNFKTGAPARIHDDIAMPPPSPPGCPPASPPNAKTDPRVLRPRWDRGQLPKPRRAGVRVG